MRGRRRGGGGARAARGAAAPGAARAGRRAAVAGLLGAAGLAAGPAWPARAGGGGVGREAGEAEEVRKILVERERVDQGRYELEGAVDRADLAARAAAEAKRQDLDAKANKIFTQLEQQITKADAAVAGAREAGVGGEELKALENRRTNLRAVLDELYKNKGDVQGEVDREDLLGRARAAAQKGRVDSEADGLIAQLNSALKDLVYGKKRLGGA